jgi:hypothetical protein
MDQTAIALLAGAMLCIVVLGIGVAIGFKLGRAAGPDLYIAAPHHEQPTEDRDGMESMLAAWVDLRLRLMELAVGVREMQQIPQGVLVDWRDDFSRLSNTLSQTLDEKVRCAEPKTEPLKITASSAPPEEIGHGDLISNDLILELLSRVSEPRDSSAPLVRYKFSAKQLLATAVEDGPLPAEAFSLVQCHDISARDIRYFVDQPPSEGRVVIGLGLPTPIKWVAAQIEGSRTAFRYGRVGYLVTARLLAAIDNRSHAAPAKPSQYEALVLS